MLKVVWVNGVSMSQCRWLVCLRAAFQDWSALLPIMSMIIRIFLRPERSNTIHFSFSQTCFKVQHLPQVKYFVAIKLTCGYNILICGHTLLRNYHCVYVHITNYFVHLRIYLFFAQIWSIHLASEHLDHLEPQVTHTVAVFNDIALDFLGNFIKHYISFSKFLPILLELLPQVSSKSPISPSSIVVLQLRRH